MNIAPPNLMLLIPALAIGFAACADLGEPHAGTCTDKVQVAIDPAAAPYAAQADGGTGLVAVTGTVSDAPCGVQSVSVLGAPASSAAPGFATWSASAPLFAFQAAPSCTTAGGAGGHTLTARAVVVADFGKQDVTKEGSTCVALPAPPSPQVCTDVSCGQDNDPTHVECQVPASGGTTSALTVYTAAELLGRRVTWTSSGGVVSAQGDSVIRSLSTAELVACHNVCGKTRSDCAGVASALLEAAPKSSNGADIVSARVAGFTPPLATVRVATQGPAIVSVGGKELANGGLVAVAVANPLRFKQTCTFGMPAGVQVGVLDSGKVTDTSACSAADAGQRGPCFASFEVDNVSQSFAISFVPGLTDALAKSVGLAAGPSVSVVCRDQFGQSATSSVPVSWTTAPTVFDASAG